MTPSTSDLIRVFGRIGLLSFGGPAAQIALMHRELVEERSWLSEARFLRALSLCMLLPGPEAMQLATYAGWRLRGVLGGMIAGGLFVLPGAIVIAALVLAYASWGQLPLVQAAFLGVKSAVVVIVIQALLKVGKKALAGSDGWIIAALSFIGIFVLDLPFPVIILAAGVWGYWRSAPSDQIIPPAVEVKGVWRRAALLLMLWLAPLIALSATGQALLADIGWFFAKLAVVTFGGAYAVLTYMTQTVVDQHGWISTGQMIDALGLAETTPGPLILVTQFVAMLTGAQNGGLPLAFAAGIVTLWATFIPCFLWIFTAGPYLDHITTRPRLGSALTAISAAVVGVIANLSLWFTLTVVFGALPRIALGPVHLPNPDLSALNPSALILIALAAAVMIAARRGIGLTLLICAAASLILAQTGL